MKRSCPWPIPAAIYFGRIDDATGRVVGEEVQHAIDFTQGATEGNILRHARRHNIASKEIQAWWHRRVFTRQIQNIANNRHGFGVLQDYSDDVYQAYQKFGGQLTPKEILSRTFNGLY